MSPLNRVHRGEIVQYQKETPSPRRRIFRVVFIALFLLAAIILAGIHFLRPALSSKGMSGIFMNAVAVPSPERGHRLWILSDGSFHYILREESPGRVSVGRKCKFCKTWTYVYDPAKKTILAKFKTDYKSVIIQSWMAYLNGKIWIATDAYEQNEPRLFAYSTEPAGLFQETPDIIKKYSELGSGLIKVRMAKDPDRFILDTKDGRVGLVLVLSDGKIYANESEFRKAMAAGDEEQVTVFALGREDSGPRRELFKVTGPRVRVKDSSLEFFLKDPKSLLSSAKATAVPVAPGCAYIEGMIFYQDPDGCLILHQDVAGKVAQRLLTCLDANGNEKWTAGMAELFKEMKVDLDKNALSNIFFMKDKLDVSRSGSLVLLQLRGVGVIGFDFATGKKMWEIRL
jgi:hypothetical protein